MKRNIIQIDETRCNGCGVCIPNCPEGALQLIDGKARLVSDLFCDGLGACIGECPQKAILVVEREAEPYDERKVMANIVRQGENTIKAHLKHLKAHGENELLEIALAFLREQKIAIPPLEETALPCGCPGTLARLAAKKKPLLNAAQGKTDVARPSALRQWPVQLHLLNPEASYFDGADLLVAADCTAFAHGDFHRELLEGRILVVFCPKLDHAFDEYAEKLATILKRHEIRSITIARMEVPCCGGTTAIVEKALELAQKKIPVDVKILPIGF